MKKTLIVLAHLNIRESRVNKALLEAIANKENVTVHNLYNTYPDFKFNIELEQKLLLDHDNIVLQFPIYNFGTPAILKHWIDIVIPAKFISDNAKKLKTKVMQIVTTTGYSIEQYIPSIWSENQKNNPNNLDFEPKKLKPIISQKYDKDIFNVFLASIEQTSYMMNVRWMEPFIINSAKPESVPHAITKENLDIKVKEYIKLINNLDN